MLGGVWPLRPTLARLALADQSELEKRIIRVPA